MQNAPMTTVAYVSALVVMLGAVTATSDSPPAAWPLRARVTDPHGQRVSFRAVSHGGTLVVEVSGRSMPDRPLNPAPELRALARGDTLRAATPAEFPLDLVGGPVEFFVSERDSIRVVIGRNPFGMLGPVSATGHRLTARLVNGAVAIDAR